MKHVLAMMGLVVVLLVPGALAVAQGPDGMQEYILFMDTFRDGQADNWTITGGWRVQQTGNIAFLMSTEPGLAYVTSGSGWTDYIYRSAIRLDAGTMTLSFRMTEEARYLIQYQADGLYLVKEQPQGNFTTLTQTIAPTLGTWHPIAIACQGGRIQVYVNKEQWLDYTDSSPLSQGTVGVGVVENSTAGIGNVLVLDMVRNLPASPPVVQPGEPVEVAPQPAEQGWGDVVFTDVTLNNYMPIVGEQITIQATVTNTGTAAAEGFDVVLIPAYGEGNPNNPAGLVPVPALQPGAQQTLDLQMTYPIAGQFTLRLLATDDWYLTGNTEPDNANSAWDVPVTVVETGGMGGGPAVDLVIAGGRVAPLDSPPGAVSVDINVRNAGTTDAGAFTVRWYPHAQQDVVGCSQDVQALPAGESVTISCTHQYENFGEMHYLAVIDADDDIDEWDEENNERRGTVNVASAPGLGRPDLVFARTGVAFWGDDPGGVIVTLTIQNAGTIDAGAFTVRWYPHGRADVVGCSEDVPGLAAGATVDVTCTYTYPANGQMHWRAEVDADNDIGETNEHNNTEVGIVNISGVSPGEPPPGAARPDLVLFNLRVAYWGTEPRGVIVAFRVQNTGEADAGAFTFRWYPHANSDVVGCSIDIPSVAAGATTEEFTCTYTYPQNGNMHWLAVVDADNDINESNERNNEESGTTDIAG